MASTLTLASTLPLSSRYAIPVLGSACSATMIAAQRCSLRLSMGYRHIDSARMYRNEAEVGKAVRQSGLKREDIFITTKVHSGEHGYENTVNAVNSSLSNFGFDYVDLYLLHDPRAGTRLRLEAYRALLDLKKARKIRSVGVSNYGPHHLEEIRAAGLELPSVNQVELHPFCQQKPIVDYCRQHDIVVEAYTPLVKGKADHPVLVALAKKYNKDVRQILVRWSLQRGFVPLPKSAQPVRVRSNADVFSFALEDEEVARIDALDQGAAGAVTWNPVDVP